MIDNPPTEAQNVPIDGTGAPIVIENYLTAAEVADLAGVSVATIHKHTYRGTIPDPDVRMGKTPLWHKKTISQWLKTRPSQGQRTDRKATK